MSFPLEVCGCVGGMALYRMHIKLDDWQRIVALTKEGVEGLPDWLDYGLHTVPGLRVIATTDPTYFNPALKEDPRATYTRTDQEGFSQL